MWKVRKRVRKKEKRERAKMMLERWIRWRYGWSIPKRIVIRIEDMYGIDRRKVKIQGRKIVEGMKIHEEAKREIKKRVSVVGTREKNISEILVNHKRIIENFKEEEKPECKCGNKRRHVVKRAREWDGIDGKILKKNAKNVPSELRNPEARVIDGLIELWKRIKNMDPRTEWRLEKKGEVGRSCRTRYVDHCSVIACKEHRWSHTLQNTLQGPQAEILLEPQECSVREKGACTPNNPCLTPVGDAPTSNSMLLSQINGRSSTSTRKQPVSSQQMKDWGRRLEYLKMENVMKIKKKLDG